MSNVTIGRIPEYSEPLPKNPTPEQRIKWLEKEVKRVKIQRNEYEQDLMKANRELNRVRAELALLENYVNRKDQNPKS